VTRSAKAPKALPTADIAPTKKPHKASKAPPTVPLIEPEVQTSPDWRHEELAWTEGWVRIAGVDEAGRGPLAGPVFAAAVIFTRGKAPEGLNDSKKLDPETRERLYLEITARAEYWSVAFASVEEIDEINILRASHLAMARALSALAMMPCGALVDGLRVSGLPCPHKPLVKGDSLSVSIAAASILAKVTRDRHMTALAEQYPGYGFERHKGYSTPEHFRTLKELGPCAIHRRSFSPVASALSTEGEGDGGFSAIWEEGAE
jgi:ribonuclease HII